MLNTQVKSWSLLQHRVHLEIQECLNHPLVECDFRTWSGDSPVVRAPDSWSEGCGFRSPQELWKNFLLLGQFSVLTLIMVSLPPRVTAVAHKRPWSFCKKYRWHVTAKHTFTLRMWLCMKWHGAWLYGVRRTCWDGSSFMWHQPCQVVKFTTSVDIQKHAIESYALMQNHMRVQWVCLSVENSAI